MALYILIALAAAFGLFQLGAMSVWIAVLAAVIKTGVGAAVLAVAVVGGLYFWRRYQKPTDSE